MAPASFFRRTALVAAVAGLLCSAVSRGDLPYEEPPIDYIKGGVKDPIALMQQRIDRGEVKFAWNEQHGWLESVLKELKLAPSSQVLVFSKTSFQRSKIAPDTPRALYFNDHVYVGWVQEGDVMEFTAMDPRQGAIFYALPQEKSDKPVFERKTHDCLLCHSSAKTEDVPGHLVRSVFPAKNGNPVFNAGMFVTTHDSPFKQRWGGWYVTGKHGGERHMGNAVVTDMNNPEKLDVEKGANRTDLKDLFNTKPYLTDQSDIVALMVLEHQSKMHNLLTRANFETRLALHYDNELNKALGRPADYRSESTGRRIKSVVDALVEYMLFSKEAKLLNPVAGTTSYAQDFAAQGPRDGQGRSLRDFDLGTRMFKYPCSFLIYSESFDELPPEAKSLTYARLRAILTGQDQDPKFERLSSADRQAIYEILCATKSNLPGDWKPAAASAAGR